MPIEKTTQMILWVPETVINPSLTVDAIHAVVNERGKQDAKWGQQRHPLLYWLGIIGEEFGEVSKEMIEEYKYPPDEWAKRVEHELIQLTAVCIGCLEQIREPTIKDL